MGVIERLPQFQTFISPTPSLSQVVTKPVAFQQVSLEQATIEDYYAQAKHPTVYHQSVVRPKTFLGR